MKFVFQVVIILVVTLVAIAIWLTAGFRGSSLQSSGPVEVVWRGFIVARVIDFVNMSSLTDFFLDFGNGTRVPLDLSNATLRLRDHFAVYVGNPDRPVYVRGVWDGKVLKAVEVYD